jgi:HSP20 family protein
MVMRRPVRRTLPDLIDWAENLPEAFTWANWPTSPGVRGIRVEEFVQDGRYVVRAELPGMDPEGIRVEVDGDVLVIHAERSEEKHERGRTEFQYGTFERRVALPEGADESGITARYDAGVLEVSVPVREVRTEPRAIPVQRSGTVEGSVQESGHSTQESGPAEGSDVAQGPDVVQGPGEPQSPG